MLMPDDFKAYSKIKVDHHLFNKENMPSHFKMKEYCPMVFRNLRERFAIDDQDFQNSLTRSSLFTNDSQGRSGARFHTSCDKRYVVKTITSEDVAEMHNILKKYHQPQGLLGNNRQHPSNLHCMESSHSTRVDHRWGIRRNAGEPGSTRIAGQSVFMETRYISMPALGILTLSVLRSYSKEGWGLSVHGWVTPNGKPIDDGCLGTNSSSSSAWGTVLWGSSSNSTVSPSPMQFIVECHGNTLLPQFLGMYRLTVDGVETYMIVTRNVFSHRLSVYRKYDLKAKELPTYKDNDFINDGQKIYIDENNKKMLLEKLKKDVEFLAQLKLMDYSLLVGIHDVERAEQEEMECEENEGEEDVESDGTHPMGTPPDSPGNTLNSNRALPPGEFDPAIDVYAIKSHGNAPRKLIS
ncbi:UNVERIFIED_CONTAM: hypothetical protein FKN15_076250 [Acipenser sinensis]